MRAELEALKNPKKEEKKEEVKPAEEKKEKSAAELELEKMRAELEALKNPKKAEEKKDDAKAEDKKEDAKADAKKPVPGAKKPVPGAAAKKPAPGAAKKPAAADEDDPANDPAYQEMIKRKKLKMNLIVFGACAGITLILVLAVLGMKGFFSGGGDSGAAKKPAKRAAKTTLVKPKAVGADGSHVAIKEEPKEEKSEYEKDYDALVKLTKKQLNTQSSESALEQIDNNIAEIKKFIEKWEEEKFEDEKFKNVKNLLNKWYEQRDFYAE